MRKPKSLKITALILAILMTANGVPPLLADEISSAPRTLPDIQGKVVPDPSFGLVDEAFQGARGQTLYLILDAHDSLEAQQNIARLIGSFAKRGVTQVFEEGYEGEVPVQKYFGAISDWKEKKKVADYLLDRLRIGGAEYARILGRERFQLTGAENRRLYEKNLAIYRNHSGKQEAVARQLEVLANHLKRLSDKTFPAALKDLMRLRERFDAGQINLSDYLQRITRYGFDAKQFPVMAHARDGRWQEISVKDLFSEMGAFESSAAFRLLHDSDQRKLYRWMTRIGQFKKLNAIAMTPEEFSGVPTNDGITDDIADFIQRSENKSVVLNKKWERNIASAVEFYEIALARERAVTQTLDNYF